MMVIVFSTLSLLAIIAGGVISAFTARRPTQLTAWVSAYLVLVVGMVQLGLITTWQQLGQPNELLGLLAFIGFNVGSLSVIIGTLIKACARRYGWYVNGGGFLIAIAMILLLVAIRNMTASLTLTEFVGLAIVILISMPIGLILSSKRRDYDR